jgi:hypothetical protein
MLATSIKPPPCCFASKYGTNKCVICATALMLVSSSFLKSAEDVALRDRLVKRALDLGLERQVRDHVLDLHAVLALELLLELLQPLLSARHEHEVRLVIARQLPRHFQPESG